MKTKLPLFLALLFTLTPPLFAAAPPPNIIIFLTDDQGYGDVGCYGRKNFATLNFDRFARGLPHAAPQHLGAGFLYGGPQGNGCPAYRYRGARR